MFLVLIRFRLEICGYKFLAHSVGILCFLSPSLGNLEFLINSSQGRYSHKKYRFSTFKEEIQIFPTKVL